MLPRRRTHKNPNFEVEEILEDIVCAVAQEAAQEVAQANSIPTEDFVRDKDLKTLLKFLQPKAFTRRGVRFS